MLDSTAESHQKMTELSRPDCKLVIGIDEAGYGPNLGPLVVAGSVWSVPNALAEPQWNARLEPAFADSPWTAGSRHVPLGDSKRLYQRSQGLDTLEAGVVCLLSLAGVQPGAIQELAPRCIDWDWQAPHPPSQGGTHRRNRVGLPTECPPWYDMLWNARIPESDSHLGALDECVQLAGEVLKRHGMRLLGLHCVLVTEPDFNRKVERLDSKGQLLSETSLQLAHRLMEQYYGSHTELAGCPIEVYFDRQGGRKNYSPLLMQEFPDTWFATGELRASRSSYHCRTRPWRFFFTVRGDCFPPVAAASMWAKYMRERAMQALNAFWRSHVTDLLPTAGYPRDAVRFEQRIAAVAERLGIPRAWYWRCR
ncbi:MAG: hypothetical protein D6753_17250 [Planctomycetota bacterium]|nr:MAG: hypothetical protein D6753_17250 [Planctomycetota bacterium]